MSAELIGNQLQAMVEFAVEKMRNELRANQDADCAMHEIQTLRTEVRILSAKLDKARDDNDRLRADLVATRSDPNTALAVLANQVRRGLTLPDPFVLCNKNDIPGWARQIRSKIKEDRITIGAPRDIFYYVVGRVDTSLHHVFNTQMLDAEQNSHWSYEEVVEALEHYEALSNCRTPKPAEPEYFW
ncbi:hypothetical protein M426DRAFT_7751 [Hypoxylon sp. CI-4A]|nr:hypothetical protein M426DRAFT_7751 [Hypoxylon sp. CI-4A]